LLSLLFLPLHHPPTHPTPSTLNMVRLPSVDRAPAAGSAFHPRPMSRPSSPFIAPTPQPARICSLDCPLCFGKYTARQRLRSYGKGLWGRKAHYKRGARAVHNGGFFQQRTTPLPPTACAYSRLRRKLIF
jgi:hypothetical protein